MTRDIYLVRWSARPFKDHWAILIPSAADWRFGTLIEVEGDVRNGFTHGVLRNYDSGASRRTPKLSLIGKVADQHVHDTPSTGPPVVDQLDPRDEIEQVALSVPAPGPSMNPSSGNTPQAKRVIFNDCQWWVRKVIEKLVENGILPQGAIEVLDATPQN